MNYWIDHILIHFFFVTFISHNSSRDNAHDKSTFNFRNITRLRFHFSILSVEKFVHLKQDCYFFFFFFYNTFACATVTGDLIIACVWRVVCVNYMTVLVKTISRIRHQAQTRGLGSFSIYMYVAVYYSMHRVDPVSFAHLRHAGVNWN